jgi:tetratricopeptide (TPR) repeat protein
MRKMELRGLAWGAAVLIAAAVGDCGKVESKLSPAELVEKGWSDFRVEEFDAADDAFRTAIAKLQRQNRTRSVSEGAQQDAAAKTLRINALYGRGLVALVGHAGERQAAGRAFMEQVIALDGKGETAAWAALAIVRDEHLNGQAAEAANLRHEYADVTERFPGTEAADEAFAFGESLLVATGEAEDARRAVSDIAAYVASHPASRLKSPLLWLAGNAQETLKDYPAALAAAIASLDAKENDPADPNRNNILEYYRIGMMAQYDVGDFAVAREYFGRFLKEYPRDQRSFTVKLMLKQMDDTEARVRRGEKPRSLAQQGGAL